MVVSFIAVPAAHLPTPTTHTHTHSQVLDSENLMTLFVVVSKFGVKDWEATYEKLCDFVVSTCRVFLSAPGTCSCLGRAGAVSSWGVMDCEATPESLRLCARTPFKAPFKFRRSPARRAR